MATKLSRVYDQEAAVWPELVGSTWREGEMRIRKQFPNITIHVLPETTYIKKEFCPDRVKLIVDGEGKIVKTPSIG